MSETWERIAARVYDAFLRQGERRGMHAHRRELLAGAHGRVLEIGAGTGLNLDHYPERLAELVLTEPSAPMAARLERRLLRSGRDASAVVAPAEALPFADDSFDVVVSTLVLCTVPDPSAALHEVARVLRPDGRLLFIEHVRSPSPRLARLQRRLERPWRAFACGCHTDRDTLALIGRGPLRSVHVRESRWRGMPRIVQPLVIGSAALSS